MPRPISLSKHNPFILFYGIFVILTCLAIALVFLPSPAKAVPLPCMTADVLKATAKKKFPGATLVHIKGSSAADFMRVWNGIPPVSNVYASEVMALVHARSHVVEAIFVQNGCAFFRDAIQAGLFLKIMQFISKKPKDTHA